MSPFDPSWEAAPPLCDAVYAAALLAIDPRLGGVLVRACSGVARDSWLKRLTALTPGANIKKLPLNISDDRLLGGLDLPATLAAGKPVHARGILAEAESGFLLLAMAERLTAGTAARINAALDAGARITLVALDEGIGDEAPPKSLTERLAFTMTDLPPEDAAWPSPSTVARARAGLGHIACGPDVAAQICTLAAMFGIASTRAEIFALRAARAAAALRGSLSVAAADIALAARLVLGPRATQIPQTAEPPPPPEAEDETGPAQNQDQQTQALEDRVDAAEKAMLPDHLLAAILAEAGPRRMVRGAGTSGATYSLKRGRPVAARRGPLTGQARLSLLDTLRAAAPWQRLRRAAQTSRIAVRAEDFHIKRFKEQPRRIAIFAVDASGSSALNRLAEAKGAIQLLLAECYVQRDEVALIAFRNRAAEILLPPTSALARVRRALAALPGGGPTPLASGIAAAVQLAQSERRQSKQPLVVILTDGGANIGKTGEPGRAAAGRDALSAARQCAAQNIPAMVVDIAPRKQAFVAELARAMGGKYVPLPYADARNLALAVQGVQNARAAA